MLSHLETTKRYAYCALLTKDTYIPGLQTLARSFVTAKTAYPLIVLYNDLSDEAIEIVNREPGVIAKPIDKIIPAETAQTDYVLERFGEVCLLDLDMLCVRNIDDVFDYLTPEAQLAASPACTCNIFKNPSYPAHWVPANCLHTHVTAGTTPDSSNVRALNAGLMVFRPDVTIVSQILTLLDGHADLSRYRFPEQDLLAEMYPDWVQLPYIYNALKTMQKNHTKLWNFKDVRIVHYIVGKPWAAAPTNQDEEYPGLNQIWRNAFERNGRWDDFGGEKQLGEL